MKNTNEIDVFSNFFTLVVGLKIYRILSKSKFLYADITGISRNIGTFLSVYSVKLSRPKYVCIYLSFCFCLLISLSMPLSVHLLVCFY